MLHRALFGSLKRITGIFIEHHAGHLPWWVAPVQIVVATVIGAADSYAEEVAGTLQQAGLRVETDLRNEKIGYKVREHAQKKVPIQIAVGAREAKDRSVSVRQHGQKLTQILQLEEATGMLLEGTKSRGQS